MAVGLAVLLELGLLALLLSLGIVGNGRQELPPQFVRFEASELAETPVTEPEPDQPDAPDDPAITPEFARAEPDTPVPPSIDRPTPLTPPKPAQPVPPLIPLNPSQMASANIAKPQPRPATKLGPVYGPPDTGTPGDSQRVSGSSPTGEPLYAASWYREPTDSELAGYLSTASGPGYAVIACKTVPDFRVDNCALETEYPRGSNIGRSVMAAAWQFRVRPPRIGGKSQVGEWVRIKIDYTIGRR